MSSRVQDRFARVLGTGRGTCGHDGVLAIPGPAGAARARELLGLIDAGTLAAALAALAVQDAVPGAEDDVAYAWPPKDVAQRAERRARERNWSRSVPGDEDAELLLDPVDSVRRAVAEHVAAVAVDAWTPVLRQLAHAIGLRRGDIADHVVAIDDTLHLFEPANVLLAGNRAYTQTMGCKQSAFEPARDGRLRFVARGEWAAVADLHRDQRDMNLCPGCAASWSGRFDEARAETAQDWRPLNAEHWGWVRMNTTARTHQHLQSRPGASVTALRAFAIATVRDRYLDLVPGEMQTSDKPCLWYRAAALTDDERYEVNRATYDARLHGGAADALLEDYCPRNPDGFAATDAWRRHWCERLLEHVRGSHRV